ncbi:MAG: type I-E CRISPR-associated protein Cse1/CasA, partial [Cumulibacter sp.]
EPRGPADVFTWPSRRLRLFTDGQRVIDVQISNGDKLGPQNRHIVEPMAAWRWSKNQSKAGTDVLMPVTHDPTRRIWRGLGPLLLRANGNKQDRRAGVIDWLGTLRHDKALPATHPVDLWIVGFEYGNQNATIAGAIDDRLTAPVAALTDPVLAQAAVYAADWAREGVVALVNLASNLDRAAGGDGSAGREEAFERGYTRLDLPFRRWISHLIDPENLQAAKDEWALTASRVLRREGDALVHDAGPLAIIGRQVPRQGTDQTILLDAGLASIWFRSAIAKAFPVPIEQQKVLT